MSKITDKLKNTYRFIKRKNIDRLLLIVITLIFFGAALLMLFEPNLNLPNALWLMFATVTTVGYGDVSAQTLGGRVISVVVMVFGIGILGLFTAAIASVMVERKMKEDRGMNSFEFEDHIIICMWNYRAREIIAELRMDRRTKENPIVLIANLESKPVDDSLLYFIQGTVNEETLGRANLQKAKTVVILGDDEIDAYARDAKVVLTTLTVETLNPDVYSIVELVDEANVQHCERANADEVIVGNTFSSRLISRAAVDHGISKVLSEFLSSKIGNDLSKMPVPKDMVGKPFIELFTQLKREFNCTALAVQRGQTGKVISNPIESFLLEEGDFLIVITSANQKALC